MKAAYDCSAAVDIADEPHHHLVIANEYVRAFAVDVPPRTRTLCHRHPEDYLLFVASGAQVVSAAQGEEPKTLNYVDGECEFLKAGMVHVVENLSGMAFRNIVVEIQPRARQLRRGAGASMLGGEAEIERLLQEDAGEVVAVELSAGAELEVAGPAVLAAPYRPLMLRELEAYEIALDDFQKLMWVCAPRRVGVRNTGTAPAKLIVLQVGKVR